MQPVAVALRHAFEPARADFGKKGVEFPKQAQPDGDDVVGLYDHFVPHSAVS